MAMAVDPRRTMGVRKDEANRVLEEMFAAGGTATCPAAQIGNYADTRNRYLNCKVEDQIRPGQGHFPTKDNPLSVLLWCCDDYAACPVWIAGKERDPILDRVRAAQREADSRLIQTREIAAGIRVEDDTAATDMPNSSHKGVDESAIELAAKIQKASVEKHWSKGPKK
jgi:hypothetical protein